jgi:tRNA(Arg) A34 adenosine deaminase TadA
MLRYPDIDSTKGNFRLIDSVAISLPGWLTDDIQKGRIPERLPTVEDQMVLAIDLALRNAKEKTGGPFGTVIFETATGIIKGVGVNQVVPLSNPLLHGETVAIAMATAAVKNFNLGAEGLPHHTLVTSAQPCVMCCGATLWSGVRTLVTGASGQDVERLTGFDEGPIHPDWSDELRLRGVQVNQGVLREQACGVLEWYAKNGGIIYNGR